RWGFLPRRRPGELAFTSAQPPRLLGTKCFDWGRPKRLEFCPVPMDVDGPHGMLAVLSGDGKARALEVNNHLERQKGQEDHDTDTPCYGALRELPVDVRH